MIQHASPAKKISSLLVEMIDRLNESTAMVKELSPPEEFNVYRRADGAVMGEIVLEITELVADRPDRNDRRRFGNAFLRRKTVDSRNTIGTCGW